MLKQLNLNNIIQIIMENSLKIHILLYILYITIAYYVLYMFYNYVKCILLVYIYI